MSRNAAGRVRGRRLTDKRFLSHNDESVLSSGSQEEFVLNSFRDRAERRISENILREQVRALQAEVAERRSAQELAEEQLRQLRKFERTTSELFWTMDLQGKFSYISPSSEHLWGYTPEELIKLSLIDVMTPASLAIVVESSRKSHATLQAGLRPETVHMELEQFGKDGVPIWSEIVVEYVFDDDGVFLERRGITRDITKRKQHELLLEEARRVAEASTCALEAEVAMRSNIQKTLLIQQEQLEELNRNLEARVAHEVNQNRMKDQALMHVDKMASVGQLAAGVAHEINNPMGFISSNLNILIGYLQNLVQFDAIIQESATDEKTHNLFESINKGRSALRIQELLEDGVELINESLDGVERITKIVRDLKSFSRVDAAEEEWVTLDSCVESALNVCYDELNSVASVRKEYEPVPAVYCHYGQLNQVFMNLLVNAAQAITPRGEIIIRSWHDEASVLVSLSDTGMGMSEKVMERIFEPFFTTKDVGKGTGLGLSVSYEIIRSHKGEILVSSVPGEGTTFTVVLPKIKEVVA